MKGHEDKRICREAPIEIAECVWCGGLTLNPQSDTCACGRELYPGSKMVLPGTRIRYMARVEPSSFVLDAPEMES